MISNADLKKFEDYSKVLKMRSREYVNLQIYFIRRNSIKTDSKLAVITYN